MDPVGHVVVRMDHHDYGAVKGQLAGYRRGTPEKVSSSFNLSFHSVVNLLQRHPLERVRGLVQRSFLAHQQQHRSQQAADQSARLEARIRKSMGSSLAAGAPLPSPNQLPPPLRKTARQQARLQRQAEAGRDRCWHDLQARIGFLQQVGYLGPELEFNAGAKALLHVQISEIFVTELFLEALLDPLEPPALFGLLCGLVQTLPRGANLLLPLDARSRQLAKAVSRVRFAATVRGAERITGVEVDWSPELMPCGLLWAEGEPLSAILDRIDSDIDIAGDLVGAFRRARDLVAQLRELYADEPSRVEALHQLLRDTGRDEVEVVG